MLRVDAVGARPLDLPLLRPVETAVATLTTAPLVLVDVLTSDGVCGRSYASVYTPLVVEPLARLVENLGDVVVGASAEPSAVEERLINDFRLIGPAGLTGIAAAVIDMALWDAKAKVKGVPLAVLLGGNARPIPAYASLANMSIEAVVDEARAASDQGFVAFKLKRGKDDLASDFAVIHAVRDVVGPCAELMVDYNQSLTVDEAICRGRALDAEGLIWIEEPTRADDHARCARIGSAIDTPIQLGENWWGTNEMENCIAAHACRHVMFDAMKIGGVSGWMRAAKLAELARLPVSTHVFPEISAHLLAATPTAYRLEYVDKVGAILQQPVQVSDGHVILPDSPGTGIEWDEVAIARFL
jgi:mandelate racemase